MRGKSNEKESRQRQVGNCDQLKSNLRAPRTTLLCTTMSNLKIHLCSFGITWLEK